MAYFSDKLLRKMDEYICMHAWLDKNAKEMLQHICCGIPPRPAGSLEIIETRKYLSAIFQNMGASSICEEKVDVPFWHNGNSILETVEKPIKSFPCYQVILSKKCDIKALLFNVKEGSLEELDMYGEKLRGRIVVMGGHVISGGRYMPVPIKVKKAGDMGAAAVILVGVEDIELPALEVLIHKEEINIPCVTVSKKTGEELRRLLENGDL